MVAEAASTAEVKMPEPKLITHLNIALHADPARVVIRPFEPADDDPVLGSTGPTRSQRIADRILGLDEKALAAENTRIFTDLSERHRNVGKILARRFHEVNGLKFAHCAVEPNSAQLIGAFFSEEYSVPIRLKQTPTRCSASPGSGVGEKLHDGDGHFPA
jgi:hypothetical protein